MPKISGLGHVGIFTNDLMTQRTFYSETLGLTIADEDLEMGIVFLSSDPEAEHHEFVLLKRREPAAGVAVQQISFKVPSLDDLRDFYHRLQEEDVKFNMIVSHGNAFGMYFDDPEGNNIELYYKTGFPVPQPHADPIDLDASNEELLAQAEALIPSQ